MGCAVCKIFIPPPAGDAYGSHPLASREWVAKEPDSLGIIFQGSSLTPVKFENSLDIRFRKMQGG
jgi:hypothetical protein